MNYILSTEVNSSDWVAYDNDLSPDYREFLEGKVLGDPGVPLFYSVTKKEYLSKLKKQHLLSSSGPDLVSDAFRKVIEEVAAGDVEFFSVSISFGNEAVEGFSAINLKHKTSCLDMTSSEFKATNFDPANPTYRFYYMVVDQEPLGANIVRCKEMARTVVVSDAFKEACRKAKLKGLVFYQAMDMTYNNRTVKEVI